MMNDNNFLKFLAKMFLNTILIILSSSVVMGLTYFLALQLFKSNSWALGLAIFTLVIYILSILAIQIGESDN